jgi:hypothetical protein
MIEAQRSSETLSTRVRDLEATVDEKESALETQVARVQRMEMDLDRGEAEVRSARVRTRELEEAMRTVEDRLQVRVYELVVLENIYSVQRNMYTLTHETLHTRTWHLHFAPKDEIRNTVTLPTL